MGYVCLRCRFRLLVASRGVQGFGSRAAQYSTNASEPRASDAIPNHASGTNPRRAAGRGPRVARPKAGRKAEQADDTAAIAMFQSIVNEQGASDNITLVKEAEKIQRLTHQAETVADAYALFRETLYPRLRDLKGTMPQIVRELVGSRLFPRVAAQMAKNMGSPEFPTVAQLTEAMVKLDVMKPAVWGTLMLNLLDNICKLSTTPNDYPSIQGYETAMARRDVLMHDLVDAWGAFGPWSASTAAEESGNPVTAKSSSVLDDKSAGAGASSPSRATDHCKQQRKPAFLDAFADLFAHLPHSTMIRPAWAAIATYSVLRDPKQQKNAVLDKALPFLESMRQLIAKTELPVPSKEGRKRAPFQACPTFVGLYIQRFIAHTLRAGSVERPSSLPTPSARPLTEADIIHREVGQAYRSRNVSAIKRAWAKLVGNDQPPTDARLKELREMGDLFDYFILVYMGMRQTQLALSVWDSMIQLGIEPTTKTYTSMMQGCAKARNPAGVKAVWKRLAASGIQLDVHAWTARISGLIVSNDLDGGIAALNEMAEIWRNRDDPKYAAMAVKPSVEPVNATLVALIRLDRLVAARNVLSWAAKQGINPDIYTFNTLLRPLLRQGQTQEVQDLLSMMRTLNIHPDSATFTIILEAHLAGIGAKPAYEQVQTIHHAIRRVEAAGVEANMQTYGKMIYTLLQEPNTDPAVKAVLAHIWGRGLELSSHIYTMLAEHYFSMDPPDASAVTALIENRGLRQNKKIDRVFWERVIKVYCKVGQTDKALDIFKDLSRDGSPITFSTLYDFLLALVQEGRREEAAGVVRTVKEYNEEADEPGVEGGLGKKGPMAGGRFWKHRFWHLAEQNGLLGEGVREGFLAAKGEME